MTQTTRTSTFLPLVGIITVALAGAVPLTSCRPRPLTPDIGSRQYQATNFVPVGMGASVNVAGGNLHVKRGDLSIDTRIGTWNIAAVYNSDTDSWLHNFEMSYDGTTFVDDTGASHDLAQLVSYDRVLGTHWVKVDSTHIKTLGGLQYGFSGGRLEEVHWVGQDYPRLTFQTAHVHGQTRIVGIDQCTSLSSCEDVYDFHYTSGRVTSITDRASRSAEFTYDGSGRLTIAKDALATEKDWLGFRYSYGSERLASITNSESEEIRLEYDSAGRTTSSQRTGEHHPETRFAYFARPYRTSVTDAAGKVSTYYYDSARRITRVVSPLLNETTTTWGTAYHKYDATSVTEPTGLTTVWTFPDANRVHRHHPNGNLEVTEFAPFLHIATNREVPLARPMLSISDSLGTKLSVTYETNGRINASTNGAGETTTFEYDGLGHLSQRTSPAGVVVNYQNYGSHGHATLIDHAGSPEDKTFDVVGNEKKSFANEYPVSPDRPGVRNRVFDANRNLAEFVTRGSNGPDASVLIERRNDGRVIRVTRPHGGDHEFVYDALGRLEERKEWVDGDWQSRIWEYDALGRVSAVELPNGMRRETDYDDEGQILQRQLFQDGILHSSITYTYTNGQLVTKQDTAHGGAIETIVYDVAGLPTVTTFPGGESIVQLYDVRSRPINRIYRSSNTETIRALSFGYDAANRLVETKDGPSLTVQDVVLGRTFNNDQLTHETFGNGITREYLYGTQFGELEGSVTTDVATGQVIATIDVSGLPIYGTLPFTRSTTETSRGVSQLTDELYDMPRLLGVGPRVRWNLSEEPGGTWYLYDALNNITSAAGSTYSYNVEHNRLLAGAGHVYQYDDAGFVTSRDSTSFTYSPDGRITSMGSNTFTWDTEGRPMWAIVGGNIRAFKFGGAVEVDHFNQPSVLDLKYVKIDLQTGNHLYRHFDFRGNVKFVTDSSGDVVLHHDYNAYDVKATYGSGNDDRTFAQGQQLGDGLIMLGERVYDSDIGRFLQPDPVFQTLSQYQYAEGNPVRLWDPDGRQASLSNPGGNPLNDSPGTDLAVAFVGLVATVGGIVTGGALWGAIGVGAALYGVGRGIAEFGEAQRQSGGLSTTINLEAASGASNGGGTGAGTGAGSGGGGGEGNGGGRGSAHNGGPSGHFSDASFSGLTSCTPTAIASTGRVSVSTTFVMAIVLLQIVVGAGLLLGRRRLTGRV